MNMSVTNVFRPHQNSVTHKRFTRYCGSVEAKKMSLNFVIQIIKKTFIKKYYNIVIN